MQGIRLAFRVCWIKVSILIFDILPFCIFSYLWCLDTHGGIAPISAFDKRTGNPGSKYKGKQVVCCTVLHCLTLHYCTGLYCTVLNYTCCTTLYGAALYCITLYCTLLYCTAVYCILQYCTALCCIESNSTVVAFHRITLYCTVLNCTDLKIAISR
jgi:hypothetical protein